MRITHAHLEKKRTVTSTAFSDLDSLKMLHVLNIALLVSKQMF